MSTSFEARFSTSKLGLPQLLHNLDSAFKQCNLRFYGTIAELHSHRGWPTVMSLEFLNVDSLAEAASVARNWWGLGIECISESLQEEFGRSDVIEVYFNIFRAPDGKWTLIYLESSRATVYRSQSAHAAQDLTNLQIAMCQAGGFALSMYDEQYHERSPLLTRRGVEVAIKRVAGDPRRGYLSVVASLDEISHERARELAGPRADEVLLAIPGYVVVPFLRPQ
ncbi:hypothetical protein G6O69_09270 [Pseudenhygromyxa sp. WMMC2535]|uniref:hypothetical protein n=1 Tax=Pseudenhygromyxa sp. WMMC2535 TaxID=2712867 RepID=UPI001554CBED|nr:hypothetical protein [Pseudenhygromyxa sp. WMMC2535]NVB38021.1 hypothetical protein [Pseudenhygromyxa sp. WMMC2535]